MTNNNIRIFREIGPLADHLVKMISETLENTEYKKKITIALSGGSTPEKIFKHITEFHRDTVDWSRLLFFWGDERLVPPTDDQSNYKMTKKSLLDPLNISEENVFRVKGELTPEIALTDYRNTIAGKINTQEGLPIFDIMLLGLGDDGHTASIFPGDTKAMQSEQSCELAEHPVTGQNRLTLTLPVINNAREIIFLVTGNGKADIISQIIKKENAESYPASFVKPMHGKLTWLLDEPAATGIS